MKSPQKPASCPDPCTCQALGRSIRAREPTEAVRPVILQEVKSRPGKGKGSVVGQQQTQDPSYSQQRIPPTHSPPYGKQPKFKGKTPER